MVSMDSLARIFFNHHLKPYFDPISEGNLQMSLKGGLVLTNLKPKPHAINHDLAKVGLDLRLLDGHIGHMNLLYSAVNGQLEIKLDNVSLVLSPNTATTLTRCIKRNVTKLLDDACAPSSTSIQHRNERMHCKTIVSPSRPSSYAWNNLTYDDSQDEVSVYCCGIKTVKKRDVKKSQPCVMYPNDFIAPNYSTRRVQNTFHDSTTDCPYCLYEKQAFLY